MIERRLLLTTTTVECEVGEPSTFLDRLRRARTYIAIRVVFFGLIWGFFGFWMVSTPDETPAQLAKLPLPLQLMAAHPVLFLIASFALVLGVEILFATGKPDWTPEKIDARNAETLAKLNESVK